MGFISEYKQVNRLLQQKQQVVFYAESRHYYQYFEKLIDDLLAKDVKICYITSDADDPLLTAAAGIQVHYVKWMLGFLSSRIKADVMIMTMPDLGHYLFKRSSGVGTYIYMFHAAVSTQQQYQKKAFLNYDAIFCPGPDHWNEIRQAEVQNGWKQKSLISYGYPLFDKLKTETEKEKKNKEDKSRILIAPSWFEGCIFDTCIEELLDLLAGGPYKVLLRSHPEYEKRKRKSFLRIRKMLEQYPSMSTDKEPDVIRSLPQADILITDRSGIAFEFAFGVERPVLFIDTALKEVNPDWKKLNNKGPLENLLRDQLGVSVSPERLTEIPDKINELDLLRNGFGEKMEKLKKDIFYSEEETYQKGIDFILEKLNIN